MELKPFTKKVYEMKNGEKLDVPQIPDFSNMTETSLLNKARKINIPRNGDGYINGNGEGIWVIGDDNFKNDYDGNIENKKHVVMLLNHSVYYPGVLKHSDYIVVELRGSNRPVCPVELLDEDFIRKEA